MRPRVRRTATASEKWPGHDPIALPKRRESGQNGRSFGVVRWRWPYKWDRSWGNRLLANPHLARRAMGELEKWVGWRDSCSTDSKKYGVRWKSCRWRVPYSWTWMLVLAHATLLLLYSIEDSRCWLRIANTLTYGPPHIVAKFPGVRSRLKSVLCEGGWLVSSLKLLYYIYVDAEIVQQFWKFEPKHHNAISTRLIRGPGMMGFASIVKTPARRAKHVKLVQIVVLPPSRCVRLVIVGVT